MNLFTRLLDLVRTTSPRKPAPRGRSLSLEALEGRLVPATVGISAAGVLQIVGTDAADRISVKRSADKPDVISVYDNNVLQGAASVAAITSTNIDFRGGKGNDTFNLLDTVNPRQLTVYAYGDDGDDVLFGGSADDLLTGGAGNDTLDGGYGADLLRGGLDNDTFAYSVDGTYPPNLFTPSGLPIGGLNLTNDRYEGNGGRDVLVLTEGNDALSLDTVGNALPRLNGITEIQGRGGNDVIDLFSSRFTLPGVVVRGGEGNDRIADSTSDDQIYGDGGDDQLFGNEGNDRLFGGDGNDLLVGGAGRDVLEGGTGADRFEINASLDAILDRAPGENVVFVQI